MISSKKWTQCCAEKAPTRDCKYNVRILRQICMWPRSLYVSRVFFMRAAFQTKKLRNFVSYRRTLRIASLKPVQVPSLPLRGSYLLKKNIFLLLFIKFWGTILVPRLEELRSLTSKMSFSLSHATPVNRRVHTWRGIMGNQSKISRKQGSEMYVFLQP